MPFNALRRLRQVEEQLASHINRASATLAGARNRSDYLARCLRQGRSTTHPNWDTFLDFATPVEEARQHLEDEIQRKQNEADEKITAAVKSLVSRRK